MGLGQHHKVPGCVMVETAIEQCLQIVRDGHYGWFLAALYQREPNREKAIAGIAFHMELASIKEKVKEPALQDIRYQWWAEAINEVKQGNARAHPVLQGLGNAHLSSDDYNALLDMIHTRHSNDREAPFDLNFAIDQSVAPMKAVFRYLSFNKRAELNAACDTVGEALALQRLWFGLYPDYVADQTATRVREAIGGNLNAIKQRLDQVRSLAKKEITSVSKRDRLIFLPAIELTGGPFVLPTPASISPPTFTPLQWHLRAFAALLGAKLF